MEKIIQKSCHLLEREYQLMGALFLLSVAAYLGIIFGELEVALVSVVAVFLIISIRYISQHSFFTHIFSYLMAAAILGGVVFNLFEQISWWLPVVCSLFGFGVTAALIIATLPNVTKALRNRREAASGEQVV